MIKRLEISGVHMHVDPKLFAYTTKKIGRLDRFVSRHARDSLHVEVLLKEEKLKARKNNVCEVIIHLPSATINTKESTVNMFAAIDIVEAKLKNQLKKYKETHGSPHLHGRLISKLRRIKHQV